MFAFQAILHFHFIHCKTCLAVLTTLMILSINTIRNIIVALLFLYWDNCVPLWTLVTITHYTPKLMKFSVDTHTVGSCWCNIFFLQVNCADASHALSRCIRSLSSITFDLYDASCSIFVVHKHNPTCIPSISCCFALMYLFLLSFKFWCISLQITQH